jgi:ABC-type transporter Mla MlaB component
MLRISRVESDGVTTLLLEGKLLEPWLDEIRRAIASANSQTSVRLDLSGLSFADPVGALLLATLERSGIGLSARSPLLAGLIAAAMPAVSGDQPPHLAAGIDSARDLPGSADGLAAVTPAKTRAGTAT